MTSMLRRFLIFLGILAIVLAFAIEFARQTQLIPHLIVNYHPKLYRLRELVHYGLESIEFDPYSSYIPTNNDKRETLALKKSNPYDNPMLNLRNICLNIQKDCNIIPSKRVIFCQPHFDNHFNNFEQMIVSQTLFIDNNFYLTLYQIAPNLIPSILTYMNNSALHEREFKLLNALARLLHLNCFVNFKKGEENRDKLLDRLGLNSKKERDELLLSCQNYPMIVVGASISGLTASLTAIDNGMPISCIQIYEKRDDYKRTILFDLYDKPKYDTVQVLNKFGFSKYQNIPKSVQRYGRSMHFVVQTKYIERFLAKIIFMLGIDVYYSHPLVDIITITNSDSDSDSDYGDDKKNIEKKNGLVFKNEKYHKNKHKYKEEYVTISNYSIVIGSDGFKSQVRDLFNISFNTQNTIYQETDYSTTRFGDAMGTADSIHQSSIIVDYRVTRRKLAEKRVVLKDIRQFPPEKMGFFEPYVVDLIFPRCYQEKCQLQILFNQKFNTMFDTVNLDFDQVNKNMDGIEDKIKANGLDVSQLLAASEGKKGGKMIEFYQLCWEIIKNCTIWTFDEPNPEIYLDFIVSWQLRKNEIILAKDSLIRFENKNKNKNKNRNTNKNRNQFVYLIGESAMSAHYRLGIGTNTIMDGYSIYTRFFKLYWSFYDCIFGYKSCNLRKMESFKREYDNTKNAIDIRLKKRANYQATRVFLEVNCNYTCQSKASSPFGLEYDKLLIRDYQTQSFSPAGFNHPHQAIKQCFKQIETQQIPK